MKNSIVENGDTFILGRYYAMWYPGASLMQVLSVASTLKYTGTKQVNPIEQALRFVKGYQHVNGPFYDAPEQSNKLVNGTMKISEFIILLAQSRELHNSQINREIALSGYMSELDNLVQRVDTQPEKDNTTMANNTKATTKDQTPAQKMIADKLAQQAKDNPRDYEENKSGYVNIFEVSGNLGRDTEIVSTSTGKIVAKNGLGMFNPGKHSNEEKMKTKWFDLALWFEDGVNDDLFTDFTSMVKGQKVVVKGRLTFRYWTSREGKEMETAVITLTDVA